MVALLAFGLPLLVWPQETYAELLKKHLDSAPGHFSNEQVQALADLIVRKTEAIPDPTYRDKLRADARNYVLSRASADAFVLADPLNPDGPRVDVFRGPASMAVFTHELAYRLDHATSGRKDERARRDSLEQINLLAATLSGRLGDFFEGPGARGYVDASVERFKAYMGYLAASDLEFAFRSPLTHEQLEGLRLRLATFVPFKSQIPNPPGTGQSPSEKVWVQDAGKATYHMNLVTDFGAFALVESELARVFTPPELFSETYQGLRKKMTEEIEELSKTLTSDEPVPSSAEDGRWYPGKTASSSSRGGGGSPATSPSSESRTRESSAGGGTRAASRRTPWIVGTLAALVALLGWRALRSKPARS